ncbi:tRNA (adenosine(37)-N6)-threonylcarbamoyltransferase complex ATPase subunit type 1 TsaE [Peptostreptococcus porci]|uniref:tRNA threonylcarbamoyladenosine biosynthesis protein TsaE n=1 Tax=Peptostreptococcus porci TaxID=2652282 RepID=A0A6N7X0D2_9FIRM|nr:tRNA (adenosine(37)-N6)-threonylcarbamoyltransferase complex ATPase subunit type 1 TsaE [Peptostreptococcus porci]MDY5436401.1 tRNA (adenosine(37)-N6)-threonylcarbamoyltransferase complex ATPase subunit type 1 TsaE [Peptostreptococcus porci]MST62430.1 tRNA (adenosine(37)-N6)-threonylcarbamoyltransferase complex ATPase subunit type 1 TsaE [Peptostreptococcus porci]
MKKIFLENEESTKKIGEIIGEKLFNGAILCLNGDLGAGKTTLTKSIAKALRIDEDITSPTFTIVNEYTEGSIPLYHFDVYRIVEADEMYDIGFDEYINSDGICIIEWSSIIRDILPKERLEINLNYSGMGREMEIISYGDKYKKIVEEMNI